VTQQVLLAETLTLLMLMGNASDFASLNFGTFNLFQSTKLSGLFFLHKNCSLAAAAVSLFL